MRFKHLFSTCLLGFSAATMAINDTDKVLMTIDGTPVYQSEFDYIYNKNNDANAIEQKTEEEYMDLFINFKLKVAEAKAHGMDTTQAFIKELGGYRKQLAQPYLVDEEAKKALIQEAYERKTIDVEVSHILIQVSPNATASDTLAAYKKALLAKELVESKDHDNFGDVARAMSDDPSAQSNGGYLGYISVFRTVYPFETGAYNTPVGELSDPVRSSFGYHIIKVHNRRPAQGEILVSHIMTFTRNGDDESNARAKAKIDSLYQCVLDGADFAKLATDNSEDRGSAPSGGKLPWFGTGQMVADFEKASFALNEKDEVSKPIQSPYGWHIIQLHEKRPVASFEESEAEIKKMVERDSRNAKISESYINKLKAEYNLELNPEKIDVFIGLVRDGVLKDPSEFSEAFDGMTGNVFTYADKAFSVKQFGEYILANTESAKVIPQEIVEEKLNACISTALLAQEDSQLEKKYPAFRNLINEYHDGILLFEISNQKVWERASTDVEGITKFFKKNKRKYAWDAPRFKGHVVMCKDSATMEAAQAIAKKLDSDSIENYLYKRLNDSIQYVKIERGLYEQGKNEIVDKYEFESGDYTPSEEYPYVFTLGKVLKKMPAEYTDVRGAVTSDYQIYLEEKWIKDMRKRYKVVINEE